MEPELEPEASPDVEPELEPEAPPTATNLGPTVASPSPTRTSGAKSPRQVIAFCGASGSVGKTSVSINVAFELAAAGFRVALLDLDLMAPSLLATLNQDAITAGLSGVFRLVNQGRFSADDLDRFLMVLNFDGVRLSILPGLGMPMAAADLPTDLGDQVQEIVEAVNADFVVLDKDIMKIPASGIPKVNVLKTFINGKSVIK